MIYIIGGPPRCGKTILSQKVSSKIKGSYISTDAIRLIVKNAIEKNKIAKSFPRTTMNKAPKGKFRFEVYTPKEMVHVSQVEAQSIWPSTKGLIEHLISRKQNYVIEGVNLLPKKINQLKKTKLWKHIRIMYLINTDINAIKSGFAKFKNSHDWMYPTIKHDDKRITIAAMVVKAHSDFFEKEAKKYRLKLFYTNNSFTKTLNDAQKYLLK